MVIVYFFNIFLTLRIILCLFCTKWFFIWFWIECVSLCIIILLRKQKKSVRNLEAMSKYFVTQALASVILLIGILTRYYFIGTLKITGDYNNIGYYLMLTGLLVKLGVIPNPFWFIDVVSGVGFTRLGYVLVVSKIIPLYFSFLLVNIKVFRVRRYVGVLTALCFSVLGINQSNFRKLIAYSSIANLGWFILCLPLMRGLKIGFCFIGYVLTVLPLVWVSSKVSFRNLLKRNRFYYKKRYKLVLIFCLLSLGGLPPFIGFFIKWTFFQSLIKKKLIFFSLLLIIRSLFSLYFYLFRSFKLYRLFSKNNKNQLVFSYCVGTKAFSYIFSFRVINFLSMLFILGYIWLLRVS